MALDEYLFGKAARYFRERKLAAAEGRARIITLEESRQRLTILARAITGAPVEIFPAEREGGYRNNSFFLPASVSFFPSREQNFSFYLFRVLYLAMQRKLQLNWQGGSEHSTEDSLRAAHDYAPQVLAALFEEYPHAIYLFYELKKGLAEQKEAAAAAPAWLYGKWMRNEKEELPAGRFSGLPEKKRKAVEDAVQTILKAKAVEEVVSIAVDKKQQEDYVLTHNFEKVETADEFNGVWRDFDGDDELEDHREALDELNMKFTVRVDDTAHSVYQSDFLENTTAAESGELAAAGPCITYDEWDHSRRAYREDFCRLYPCVQRETDAAYYKATLSQYASVLTGLRKMLASVNNKLQQQRRQTQGSDFDTDAVTDLFVDVRSGHSPSEKIYLSSRKKEKDLSILLLLDTSLSSDSYAAGNRVIDVEKQAAILFGEILDEFRIDFAVCGFHSKTRHHSTYITLKGFDEPWQQAKYRVGAVTPAGYTRIGPALRHSGELLSRRSARNKWLLLLSDGKPNDFDTYEGRYGINDVKQALRELNEKQVHSYALAIEAAARYYLPQMFGSGRYQVLSSPVQLVTSLVKFYEKIRLQG